MSLREAHFREILHASSVNFRDVTLLFSKLIFPEVQRMQDLSALMRHTVTEFERARVLPTISFKIHSCITNKYVNDRTSDK